MLKGGTERAYSSLSFNAPGDKLASVGSFPDYMLTVWDWENERTILHSKAFGQDVFSVRFSKDDERRLTTSGTGHIRFWKMVATFTGPKLQGSIGKFGKVELSDIAAFTELPDGKVVSGTESGSLLLWEGNFIKCRFIKKNKDPCHNGYVNCIEYDRENKCIISAGADGFLRWWSFATMDVAEVDSDITMDFPISPLYEYYIGRSCGVKTFIHNVVRDEIRFVIQDTAGTLSVVKYHKGDATSCGGIPLTAKPDAIDVFPSGAIAGLDTSPLHHLAASASKDGFVRLWDYVNRRVLCEARFSTPATCLKWVPEATDQFGRSFVVGFADGTVRLFTAYRASETDDFKLCREMVFKPHKDHVTALSFSADGQLLVTAGADGIVFFFDTTIRTNKNAWSPIRFTRMPEKVYCTHLSWRKNEPERVICSCSDGVARDVEIRDIRYLVGDRTCNNDILTFELPLPRKDIIVHKAIELAVSPSKASVAPGSPSKEPQGAGEAKDGGEAKDAAPQVNLVPFNLTNVYEDSRGNTYAAASVQNCNHFINIHALEDEFTDLSVGLYSQDGKSRLKNPSVNCISESRVNSLLFQGTSDGSIVIRSKDSKTAFLRITAHNHQVGGTNVIASSCDDNFLLSGGYDGTIMVHRMKASKIEDLCEELTKDITSGIFDPQEPKGPPKSNYTEPTYLTSVHTTSYLYGFPELSSNIYPSDEVAALILAAPRPGADAAEIESGAYSIEDAKLKSEEDARKLTAEDKKNNVRKLIAQLQKEYVELKKRIKKLPAEVKLPKESLIVDGAYFATLRAQGEEMAKESHIACEYEAVKASTLRKKITQRLTGQILVEDIAIHSFRDNGSTVVHSLPTRDLDPAVLVSLESIREMVKLEELEASKIKASNAVLGEAVKNAHGTGHGALVGGIPSDRTVESNTLTKADSKVAVSKNVRSEQRKERLADLAKHLASKPREDEDDVRDLQAIQQAEKSIGSYNLKVADDYQVPEHLRINADKKKRQIVMLEDSILALRLQYNERFLALRALKKQIIESIHTDQERIAVIDEKLGSYVSSMPKLMSVDIDPLEYPDDRDEVTPKELEDFKAASAKTKFDKVKPPAHTKVTGSKTFIESHRLAELNAIAHVKKITDITASQLASVSVDTIESLGDASMVDRTVDNSIEETLGVTEHILKKYYPDADDMDELEDMVPILAITKASVALKPNDGSKRKDQMSQAAAEKQRLLLHERALLLEKTRRNTTTFDEALDELRVERHALCASLKQAEIKLIILIQEYNLLLTFETRDNALKQKSLKCNREKSEIISGTLDFQSKMEVKMEELKVWAEKAEAIQVQFNTLVPSNHAFVEQLRKIFKKKIKRSKNTTTADGDEDAEEEMEEEDEDDDEDFEEEEIEDVCPPGCDQSIYQKVVEVREKRLDIEEVVADVTKIVDELKKSLDRLKTREKQIDKDIKSTESEIQQFQLQKQLALNQIDIYLPVSMSQVFAFLQSGELSGPTDNSTAEAQATSTSDGIDLNTYALTPTISSKSHVVLKDNTLLRLQDRIGELHKEIDEAKIDFRYLQREKGTLAKEVELQQTKIEAAKQKVDQMMTTKFGFVIDLDELEKGSDRRVEDDAESALRKVEEAFEKDLTMLAHEKYALKCRIAEVTTRNTELLNKVAELTDAKLQLTRELNSAATAMSTMNPITMNVNDDKEDLIAFSRVQLVEIESLRHEIASMQRKMITPLMSSTMPLPVAAPTVRVSKSQGGQQRGDRGGNDITLPPIPMNKLGNK